jgi:aryl-alcohol dehydrogenase-like predicted oxidoreductase
VSLLGLGGNNFGLPDSGGPKVSSVVCDQDRTTTIVRAALDAGITFIDTAEEYGFGQSEEYIGKALGSRRDEVVIATKCNSLMSPTPGTGAGAERIVRSVEGSLRRLNTDRIDLLQLHFPDPDTPIGETLEGFDRVIRDGKVLQIGCSNFSAGQIDEAASAAAAGGFTPFASTQEHYNVLNRRVEAEVIPALHRHGMGLVPYWPLSGGVLTGKYRRGEVPDEGSRMSGQSPAELAKILSDRRFDRVEALDRFARHRGHTLLELALSWLAAQDTVTSIIVGSTNPDQIAKNVSALDWQLSTDDLTALDALEDRRA